MSKIWFCATCGYEVGSRGRCHQCRRKLTASPLPPLPAGDEDDEVGYRIVEWSDRARGRLIEALVGERILHRFEDDDLVVAATDEDRVDELVDQLADGAADDDPAAAWNEAGEPLAADVDGETVLAVEQLYAAARRLRVDPTDMEADGEVAEASAGVFMTEGYPGADADTWAAVGRVTRRLLAALGAEEALEEEIRRQSAVLATLLRPIVDATASVSELAAVEPETEPEDAGAAGLSEDAGGAGLSEDAGGAGLFEGAGGADLGQDSGGADLGEGADLGGDGHERLLGAGPETSYEVPEWLPEQRALLTVLLEDRAVPHAWDGDDLVVPSVDEDTVEALFDEVGGVGGDDEDDEARYRAIEELFAAVGRLAGDPDDKERKADVLANAGAVEGPTPLGFDDGKWLALRRRARTLADSLEHEADPDVVAEQAASLRDALREVV